MGLSRALLKWGDRGELTLPGILGLPRAPFAVVLGLVLVGVLVVLAGGVVYLVRIAQALRGSSQAGRHEVMP